MTRMLPEPPPRHAKSTVVWALAAITAGWAVYWFVDSRPRPPPSPTANVEPRAFQLAPDPVHDPAPDCWSVTSPIKLAPYAATLKVYNGVSFIGRGKGALEVATVTPDGAVTIAPGETCENALRYMAGLVPRPGNTWGPRHPELEIVDSDRGVVMMPVKP